MIADASEGYDDILSSIYTDRHALRLIDQRAAAGDDDPLTCLTRGYDAQGVPLCPHGYRLSFNGHDYTPMTASGSAVSAVASNAGSISRSLLRHRPTRPAQTPHPPPPGPAVSIATQTTPWAISFGSD